ncbi:MAG TPA: multidrug effflux MFS transporter [Rugosimonospora sp.]|nr:multidrug effflux MFS transporter [Rugosimonospora sp.]
MTVPERRGRLVVVLGALTAVAPLTIDAYVPGFPELTRSLHTGPAEVQLSMTAFLVGLAAGQILLGPVSDGLGRRRVILAGVAAYTVLSVACALAPGITVLVGARFLAGVAAAAGVVVARAVVTDRFQGRDIPRTFSLLSVILGVAPVAAPVLGGLILAVSSWRAIFVVQAGVGLLLLATAAAWVPESLPPERRQRGGLSTTFRAMGALAARREVLGYVLVTAFTGAALFTYIAGATFVFQDGYHVSTTGYSLVFATNATGMLLASALFGALAARVRVNTLLTAAVSGSALASAALVAVLLAGGGGLAVTWSLLVVALAGIGVMLPASMTIGQVLGRRSAGAASALMGGLQFLFGAVASPLVGAIGAASALPMAVIMAGALGAAVLALLCLARPWQGHGEPHLTSRGTLATTAAPAGTG